MLAVDALSAGTQSVILLFALVSFIVAAVLALIPFRSWVVGLIAVGLALWVLVPFWNALAAS